jgi:hypothetical protein
MSLDANFGNWNNGTNLDGSLRPGVLLRQNNTRWLNFLRNHREIIASIWRISQLQN